MKLLKATHYLLFFCFLIFWATDSFCQQVKYSFENIRSVEGLSNFDVLCFAQDSSGFLWIGTEQGLLRYDGYTFKKFQYDKNKAGSINNNQVEALLIDRQGLLWVGTRGGLSLFNKQNEAFIPFDSTSNVSSKLGLNEIWSINQDLTGNIWVGTLSHGLFCLEQPKMINDLLNKNRYNETSFVADTNNSTALQSNTIYSIVFDNYNNGWIGTKKGLSVFQTINSKSIHFKTYLSKDVTQLSDNKIWKLFFDKKSGNVWAASDSKMLCCIKTSQNVISKTPHVTDVLSLLNNGIGKAQINSPYSICIDNNGRCLVGTNGEGLLTFDYDWKHKTVSGFQQLKNDLSDPNSVVENHIAAILQDKEGNNWFGTNDGLSRTPSLFFSFQIIPVKYDKIDLSKRNLLAVNGSENGLWIGGDSVGIWYFTPHQQKFINLNSRSLKDKNTGGFIVTNILLHPNGSLFIGTSLGLFLIDSVEVESFKKSGVPPQKIKYFNRSNTSEKLCSDVIFSMCKYIDNTIWIATGRGVCSFDVDKEIFKPIIVNNSNEENPAFNFRTICSYSADKTIWAGSGDGVYKINPKNLSVSHYTTKEWTWLAGNSICQIFIDNDNSIWIATNRGLNNFNPKSDKSFLFSTKSGLSSDNVLSVIADKQANIWCATENGISQINANENKIRNYNKADGLLSNGVNERSVFLTEKGTLVFGCVNGLISFKPDLLPPPVESTRILFTDFKILNKSIFEDNDFINLKNKFLNNHSITLKYNQNFFSIDFSSVLFSNAAFKRYTYILEGVDPGWATVVGAKTITYNGVTDGDYTFKIKTANADGTWSNTIQSLNITITPPFYKTWWFLSTVFLSVISIVIYVVRYFSQLRLKEQIREQEKLLAIERERNRISEDLHDDLGAGLSSIAMMTGLMKDLVTDDASKETAEDVSSEATELVGRMREIIWSMNSKNDTIENLISYLHEYADKYLSRNKIECKFQLRGEIPEQNITAEKRENIFLVTKETLHNIVKYAQSPLVNLDVTIDDKKIIVEVFDNGKGFDINNIRRFGNGLINMKQRMETVGGNYHIESAVGKGTRTKIQVKVI